MSGFWDLVYLCREIKHPSLLAGVERLGERARADAWSHEDFLACGCRKPYPCHPPGLSLRAEGWQRWAMALSFLYVAFVRSGSPGALLPRGPSEPGVRLSPHRAQAGPKDQGLAEARTVVAMAVRNRYRQPVCTSRSAVASSDVPCPRSMAIAVLRTALRVTVTTVPIHLGFVVHGRRAVRVHYRVGRGHLEVFNRPKLTPSNGGVLRCRRLAQ